MFKRIVLLLGLGLIWTGNAYALNGFYGGLGIGGSKTNYSASNQFVTIGKTGIVTDLNAPAFFPGASTNLTTTKDTGFAGRFYGGYGFKDIFGLEVGLSHFGKTTISDTFGISSSNPATIPGFPNLSVLGDKAVVHQSSVDLMGKVDIPILNYLHGFFQLGAAYIQLRHPDTTHLDTTTTAPGVIQYKIKIENETDYTTRPAVGVGFGYYSKGGYTFDLTFYRILGSGKDIGFNFGKSLGNSFVMDTTMVTVGVGFQVT